MANLLRKAERKSWRRVFAVAAVVCLVSWACPFTARPAAAVHSLTLEEALALAVSNHPLLGQGRAGVEIQQGAETAARSPELPQIAYTGTFQRANSRLSTFGASQAFTNYTSVFSLDQLLTDFGKTSELVRAAHEQVVSSREALQNDLEQVLFGVYQAYYQLLQAKAAVKVQEQSVLDLTDHLNQAESFFRVGTRPKIDVTQAEVNLSNGRLSLVQAENNYAIAQTNLKAAMGTPDFPPFEVTETLQAPEYAVSLDQAVRQAYEYRPDLLALTAQQLAAQANLSSAQKGYFPDIHASASSGQLGPTFYPASDFWSFGVQLSWPIFNGLLTSGEIQQTQGQWHQLLAQVAGLKLTVRQSVEQAYNNFVSVKTGLRAAEDSLKYAKENFDLANGRYATGVGNYIEYTDAQLAYAQARSNLINALTNYNIAIASVKQAVGILEGP